jgi:hypothetical protein
MPPPLPNPKRLRKDVAKNRASRQEGETAKRIRGETVRGSGCGFEGGDAKRKGVVRIECKTTTKSSFSVTRNILGKIERAALTMGELPALQVEFIDGKGMKLGAVLVMPDYALEALLGD